MLIQSQPENFISACTIDRLIVYPIQGITVHSESSAKCLNHNAAHKVHHEGQETRGHISCHGDGSRLSDLAASFSQ